MNKWRFKKILNETLRRKPLSWRNLWDGLPFSDWQALLQAVRSKREPDFRAKSGQKPARKVHDSVQTATRSASSTLRPRQVQSWRPPHRLARTWIHPFPANLPNLEPTSVSAGPGPAGKPWPGPMLGSPRRQLWKEREIYFCCVF
jgi:hypothetical protein